jgi:hypothetical protein
MLNKPSNCGITEKSAKQHPIETERRNRALKSLNVSLLFAIDPNLFRMLKSGK